MSQCVAGDGGVEMLPVYEVAADGVSPVHIAPLAAVGVILEVEVVLAVLVCQSVGVVHPTVQRCVVVYGAVVVGVGGVEGVGELQCLSSYRTGLHADNLDNGFLALCQCEGHAVVYLVHSQAYIHPCVGLLAGVEENLCLGACLLYGEDEVLGGVVYCYDGGVTLLGAAHCLCAGCCAYCECHEG